MMKSFFLKKLAFMALYSASAVFCLRAEASIGVWSQKSPSPNRSIFLPLFSVERLIVSPFSDPVIFSARINGLEKGSAYLVTLPYAEGLSVSDKGQADMNSSGGTSLLIVATDSEAVVTASVNRGMLASEFSLRGARVRSLTDASVALVVPWFVLALFSFFSIARIFIGATTSIKERKWGDEAFFALTGAASLLLLSAMFRYVSVAVHPSFTAEIEARLRAVGGIAFLAAAVGGIAATKPFRRAVALAVAVAGLGLAALVAAWLPFVPSSLPMAAFCAAAMPICAGIAVASFRARRRYDSMLSVAAAFGAASLCLSAVAVDPFLESVLSCTAVLPFMLVSLRSRFPRMHVEVPEPVLSDYVDQVSIALTRFVPKEFLAILKKNDPADLRLGDHVKKDMTIFFSDIRSFTSLSETLTPEENFRFINSYLSRVVPVVNQFGGFVDKYIGDAIMALFPDEDGADSAVRAAIEMQKRIVEYNIHRASCGYRSLSMGIGLHTGTLMLGVVGVEDRMQSTVISDAVNLASRLESITKVFNVSLAISEETFKSLADPGAYMYRFIGKVRVKGKLDPVSVFEIFDGINEELFERKMKANRFFEQGMLCYYQKDFPGAMFFFRKVLETLPEDGASAFYLDNCLAKARV